MSDRRLTPELLLGAYAAGVFPMAENRDARDVFWVDPRRRGVLPLDGFHLSKSLVRRMRQPGINASIDQDFSGVLDGCADRKETWINDTIRELMTELFEMGYAHSFEVWQDDVLSGGMYGVALGGAFFGESMFSRRTDSSKMTLAFAVDHLQRTGFKLFDTQFLTDHLASLGAIEISRNTYRKRLAEAMEMPADIHSIPLESDPQAVVQRITQIS